MKNLKNWKKQEIAILAIMIAVALTALGVVIYFIGQYIAGDRIYQELQSYVFFPEETPQPPADPSAGPSSGDSEEEPEPFVLAPPPIVDFASLTAINSDCIGWIYLQNSAINYPLVHGSDNEFYQSHTFYKTENNNGAIFLEVLNNKDLSDQNSIFYGHHMKNGSMFAGLVNFTDQEYYDTHSACWIVTPKHTYKVEFFAGFLTDTESDVWQIHFSSESSFQIWLNSMAKKSYFTSDVVPTVNDRIITLSTCSYETDNARFVVMGVLREQS